MAAQGGPGDLSNPRDLNAALDGLRPERLLPARCLGWAFREQGAWAPPGTRAGLRGLRPGLERSSRPGPGTGCHYPGPLAAWLGWPGSLEKGFFAVFARLQRGRLPADWPCRCLTFRRPRRTHPHIFSDALTSLCTCMRFPWLSNSND